jgi:hypothetical protein
MKIRINLLIISVLLLVQMGLSAQDVKYLGNRSFWGNIEVGYGLSIADNRKDNDYNYKNGDSRLSMANLRLKTGYYLTPLFSLGIGIGICNYINPGKIQTIPVFADIRYHFEKLPKLYVFTDIGASFFNLKNLNHGFISDIGAGYEIHLGKRCILTPSIGYNLVVYNSRPYDISDNQFSNETCIRHSICARLALGF